MSYRLRWRRPRLIVCVAAALLVPACARPRPSTVPRAAGSRGLVESSLVAYRFAPVFLQARSNRRGDGKEFEDYFVRYDYDGNASGFNNWEDLSTSGVKLEAVVYAAVRQTAKNYYLHYVYFHPRDPKLIGKHENDLEGAMVVVKKGRAGGPDARDISLVQVQAHNRWDYARLDTLCRMGTGEGLDKAVCTAAGSESRTHPVLTSQVGHNFWFNQGHGTEIPRPDDLPRKRTTYVPWTKAHTPPMSSGDAGVPDDTGAPVTYVLVSLSGDVDGDNQLDHPGPFGDPPAAGLWDRRRDVRIFGKDEKSPGHGLQGDDGCKANTPWGWTGFGDARPGIFFLEPTREPAWSELRSRGVMEDQGAALSSDPYGNDTDLSLYPPTPGPLACNCAVMHAAFVDASSSTDPLGEGAACESEAALLPPPETIAPAQWDTCRELREWVPEDAGERVRDQGEESAASCFLQLSGDVLLRWPPEGAPNALRGSAPSLRVGDRGPITHIEVRARARTGRLSLGGFFLQAGIEYDESLGRAPKLLPMTVGPEWTTVRFALNASPDFNPDAPPSLFVLSPDPSSSLQPTRSGRVPPGPSWEVDRITLLSEGSPRDGLSAPPVIESVTPARVAYGDTVTVSGSGFSTVCAFNDVRLGDRPQLVLTCAANQITFQARGTGSMLLSIRTANGVASAPRTRPPVVDVAPAR